MAEEMVVLVTGASSGIGKSIAALLSSKGYKVYGTSRNPSNGATAYEMLKLDVNSDESVRSCISLIMKKSGRIDVLVNNAGYAMTGAIEELSISESKSQFDTNFFGMLRVTNEVLPIMREQSAGRIINMGSLAGSIPVAFQGMYAATKAAVLAYSDALRKEVKNLNIKVSVIEPGFFNTKIIEKNVDSSKRIEEYRIPKERVLSKLRNALKNGGDPQLIAETVFKIIESPSPRLRYPIGKEKIFLPLKKFGPEPVSEYFERKYWELDR